MCKRRERLCQSSRGVVVVAAVFGFANAAQRLLQYHPLWTADEPCEGYQQWPWQQAVVGVFAASEPTHYYYHAVALQQLVNR